MPIQDRLEEVVNALVLPEARQDHVRIALAAVLVQIAQDLHEDLKRIPIRDVKAERLERIDERTAALVAQGLSHEAAFERACREEED